MDLADLTAILTFLAAVLGVIAGALPFFKKSEKSTKGCEFKKIDKKSIAIVYLKKSGITTQVVNVPADTTEVVEIKKLVRGGAIIILKKAAIISFANILKKSSDTTERDIFKKLGDIGMPIFLSLLPYSTPNNLYIKKA